MGLTVVDPGHVATIVTSLEMVAKPPARPIPFSPLSLYRWASPPPDKYRILFRRVGEPWLWFSRLVMSDEALIAATHDPNLEVYAVRDPRGIEVGLLELDFRDEGVCELAYFGLVPELTGQGFGRWLMAHALSLGWRPGIERLWVHTCTLDHPRALGFYRASGFRPFGRAVETFADPRVAGLLPRTVAPHVPLIEFPES